MRKVSLLFCWILIVMITACGVNEPIHNSEESTSMPIGETMEAVDEETENMEIEDLSEYFYGYEGCFVLYDTKADKYTIYNESRSNEEIAPCSTFKVVNTLIGLETHVVEDENTVFKWDGTIYPIDSWEQDLNLGSALKYSAFWYYQKIASGVGEKRIQEFLDRLDYGNKDISGGITQFWQQSSLKISPREQVEILRKIYTYDTPFSRRNIDILKEILEKSNKNGIVLSGKTGSGLNETKFIQEPGDEYVNGWFIGFVESTDNVFYFATNLSAEKDANGSKAKEITLKILRDRGVIQ